MLIIALFLFPLIMIQIIGGVYFMLRLFLPPMVSFRQATSKFWVIASSILIWVVWVIWEGNDEKDFFPSRFFRLL